MIDHRVLVHPLFDPSSLYGQMRSSLRAAGKMRGYLHWLWARTSFAAHPLSHQPSRKDLPGWASGQARTNGAVSAPGALPAEGEVLDVWMARPSFCSTSPLPWEPLERGVIYLCLVREVDGKHTLRCRARADEPARLTEETSSCPGSSCRCRAFLLEPEVVERLKGLLQNRPWQDAFLAETVANHYEVAQVLSAAPELEGEVRGGDVFFESLPMPEQYDTFPPRKEPLQVVIVCETAQPGLSGPAPPR